MSENLLTLFPVEENNVMESVSSTTTRRVEDQPAVVSTALTLSLFTTSVAAPRQAANPRVDRSATSLCCFNDYVQQPPLLAPPNHQQITITLFSEPQDTTALSLFPSASIIKDYLPTKNHHPKDMGNSADLIDAGSSLSLSLPTKRKRLIILSRRIPKKPIKNSWNLGNFAELIDAASSLSLSLPAKRKRLIIIGPKPKKPENSSRLTIQEEEGVAKKQKVDKISTGELAVGNRWIHKRLSTSDVNLSSRLLLPKEEITKYVLPLMDMESCRACQNRDGLRVKIRDLDTDTTLSRTKRGATAIMHTKGGDTDRLRRKRKLPGYLADYRHPLV